MVICPGLRFASLAVVLASVSAARADTSGSTRAVIRGTGADVTIVYRAPVEKSPNLERRAASDPIAEALRRRTSGADDSTIIAFLQQNQAGLPDVIDADVLRDFRRAGAGEAVISVLSMFAAVDIGETGEGAAAQVQQPYPETAAYGGGYPDLVDMGYPFYGSGFSGGGFFGRGHLRPPLGRHGFKQGPTAVFHFAQPSGSRPHAQPHAPHAATMRPRMR